MGLKCVSYRPLQQLDSLEVQTVHNNALNKLRYVPGRIGEGGILHSYRELFAQNVGWLNLVCKAL
jgi:hypothetical protein